MLSDTTDIFTILSSQASSVAPGPSASTSNTDFQTYNGCGLPPLPDYTYTGYQPPCTVTSNGRIETLYLIVPASDSSSFYGGATSVAAATTLATPYQSNSSISLSSTPINTAFAPGIFAQALQCLTSVTPSTTKITSLGATTIFSLVNCGPTSTSPLPTTEVYVTPPATAPSPSAVEAVCAVRTDGLRRR